MDSRRALFAQEVVFGSGRGRRGGPPVGLTGFLIAVQAAQQIGSSGVEGVVAVEIHAVDQGQLPNGRQLGAGWLSQLRAMQDRYHLDLDG